jgi:hypothetical protein
VLSASLQRRIVVACQGHWHSRFSDPDVGGVLSGHEPGHAMAPLVQRETAELLTARLARLSTKDPDGRSRTRSMGDLWAQTPTGWDPINVKTGDLDRTGQPNLVSLARLLRALAESRIDAYWLLMIAWQRHEEGVRAETRLVNLLDWIDYCHFDAGTGQLMLKQAAFRAALQQGHQGRERTRDELLAELFVLLEQGDRRLADNRERRRERLAALITSVAPAGSPSAETPAG